MCALLPDLHSRHSLQCSHVRDVAEVFRNYDEEEDSVLFSTCHRASKTEGRITNTMWPRSTGPYIASWYVQRQLDQFHFRPHVALYSQTAIASGETGMIIKTEKHHTISDRFLKASAPLLNIKRYLSNRSMWVHSCCSDWILAHCNQGPCCHLMKSKCQKSVTKMKIGFALGGSTYTSFTDFCFVYWFWDRSTTSACLIIQKRGQWRCWRWYSSTEPALKWKTEPGLNQFCCSTLKAPWINLNL